jgi:pyrimidine-nucleoside phosphorylase
MRAVDIITKKRDGGELSRDEINFFIQGLTSGEIADYQAAAWAMAVFFKGMTARETADLTMAMAHSGETLDLSDAVPCAVD